MRSLLALSLLVLLVAHSAEATKTWAQLAAKFPGQPGQPTDFLGTGTFRLAEWAIAPSTDNSDPRTTYDENFVLRFEEDGSHRLDFLVNYADRTELGSLMYPAALFAPYLEASVVLDERNMIDVDQGCLFNANSLPDIFVAAFWEAVTAYGTPIAFVEERDYRGLACDYFEGVIPGDEASGVPPTTVGWYNRKTSDEEIDEYWPVMYFLGPAEFEQSKHWANPTLQKVEDHLTRRVADRFPATWLCADITTAFLASGTIPEADKRSIETRSPHEIAQAQFRSWINSIAP